MKRYSARADERGEYVPTLKDAPTSEPDAAFWENARIISSLPAKASVYLRVDSDALAWFKAQGKRHLTRMNVLRS